MTKSCATCTNWQLKASPLARSGMAACELNERWVLIPPSGRCECWKQAIPATIAARVSWLAKLDAKAARKNEGGML